MDQDVFCLLSRTDGSTLEVWLPAKQVEVMTDVNHPDRMVIFEEMGIVSIETEALLNEHTDE